jgi:hypothetical protein
MDGKGECPLSNSLSAFAWYPVRPERACAGQDYRVMDVVMISVQGP